MLDGKDFVEFDIKPEVEGEFEHEKLISVYHTSNNDSEIDFCVFNMDFSIKKEEANKLGKLIVSKTQSGNKVSNLINKGLHKQVTEKLEKELEAQLDLRKKDLDFVERVSKENKELKKDNKKLMNQLLSLVGDGLDMMKVVKDE